MNHIYKVVYNVALGTYTVVGELAKGKTKSKTKNIIACVLAIAGSGVAFAETGKIDYGKPEHVAEVQYQKQGKGLTKADFGKNSGTATIIPNSDGGGNLLDLNKDLNSNLRSLAIQIDKNTVALKKSTSVAVDQVNKRIDGLDNKVSRLAYDVNKMNDKLKAGIAGATAMSLLQTPTSAGQSNVSTAIGGYRNATAVAMGYSRTSDNGKYLFKLGVSVNNESDVNYGASIGYSW